jgi:hypothetical protein
MDRGITVTKVALFALAVVLAGSNAGLAAQQSGLERLLNVAPDDVFFVAGTSGGDEVGPAFKQTAVGKMWADPQTQAFYTQLCDIIKQKIVDESSGNDANEMKFAADTAMLLLSRPAIVGVAGKQAAQGLPPAYLFVLVNAGPSKDAIAARLAKLEAKAPKDALGDVTIAGTKLRGPAKPETPAVYWGVTGDYFVLAVNDPNGFALKHLKTGGSSASSCLSKVAPNGDIFSMYCDFARLKALLKLDKSEDENVRKVSAVLASLGLDNVNGYVARVGVVGEQFVTEAFLGAPEPRTGIMAAMKPAGMKAFDVVDPNCIGATTMNIDSAVIFDTIIKTIRNVDENKYKEFLDAIATFETKSGVKVREGIIASLAGTMTFYNVPAGPSDMSLGGGSAVAIVDLKDQAKFEENMAALGTFIATESKGGLQISTQTLGDRKLNVWMIPQMAMVGFVPTWTVVNGKLVFGTSQQICKAAADRVASPVPGKSLSSLPQFRSVTANLPAGVTYVRYLDSVVYFKMLTGQVQRAWPMVTMAASQGGVALPFILPDLSKYGSQMKPAVEYCWSDKEGLHTRARGSGIEESIGGVAGGAMGLAILMPALAKVKDLADQMLSATNMKAMANAILVYSQDHNERYPAELTDLVKEADLSPSTLEYKRKPKDLVGPSYIYVAGLKSAMPASCVLIYENPGYRQGKLNVLYNDMHVALVDKATFKADLKKTYERLGQPMPKVKFMDDSSDNGKKKAASPPAEPNK